MRADVADSYNIMELLGFDTDPIVGLDIGASAVKILQLGKHGDRIRVENFAMEQLEPGLVRERNIIDRDKVVAAIKSAMKKSGIKTQKVCISISNSMAITKVLKMADDLNDKDIGGEIEIEASKYIPYPLSEINLDYTVLGPVQNSAGMMNVLLVASKSDNVDNIAGLVIDAGLNPVVVDIDAYAISRAFTLVAKKLPAQGKNKVVAIFDIGATITTMNVLENDNVIYMRDQIFGSQQLIDEIQSIYGLTYEEAILSLRYENLPKDFYPEILDPFKHTLAQQINRFCQFFFSAGEKNSIDYIFLTGGFADAFGLDKVIQDKLQFKTFVAHPFDDMLLANHINKDEFKNATPHLMKCCGLALRNIKEKK